MEWLSNVWNWVVLHKDEIVTFVTSSSFIGFIGSIIMLVRQGKAVKANTASSKELTVVLEENKTLTAEVNAIGEENATIKNMLTELLDALDKLTTKQNATLEVQSLVYQNLRDPNTRAAIQNVLTNAKYAATATRADLVREVENLKKKAAEGQAFLQESADKIKKTLEAEVKASDVVIRG